VIFRLFQRLFTKKEIAFKAKLWKTDKCFKCNKPYDKKSFWTEFTEINGTVFQVPICDDCSGKSVKAVPTNRAP
jgi:NAD-dependent SIR2 family protein deacetylase